MNTTSILSIKPSSLFSMSRCLAIPRISKYCSALLLVSSIGSHAIVYAQDHSDTVKDNSVAAIEVALTENAADIIERLNINTANAAQIAKQLKGIGKVKSQAIVEYRKINGDFSSIDELALVKGISKKLIERNRLLISL